MDQVITAVGCLAMSETGWPRLVGPLPKALQERLLPLWNGIAELVTRFFAAAADAPGDP
jgi:hypothetical protein